MVPQANANQGPPFSVFVNCLYAFGRYSWLEISLLQGHQHFRQNANAYYKTVHALDHVATVTGSPL